MAKVNYGQLSIPKDLNTQIENVFSKVDSKHEFEASFSNNITDVLNMESFLKVLEYLKLRSKINKEKISDETTLDIVASLDSSYRLTINGLENIKKYVLNVHKKRGHVIFKILLGKMSLGDKNISIMKKTREDVVDVDDYSIRFKLSREESVSEKDIDKLKKIDETYADDIIFRYKQRVSLIVEDSKKGVIRIDLTSIKQTKNINKIETVFPKYELEIEYVGEKDSSVVNKIMKEIEVLSKVINESNFVVSRSEAEDVMNYYNTLFNITSKRVNLDGRKPISLELIHLLDALPNRYAVTDKADGDRYFLIIKDREVYLISNNLKVKKTGIKLSQSNDRYNGSVLDGEYVFLSKHNRHVFLAFDCLFKGEQDIRNIGSYFERLTHADEIVDNCFSDKKGFKMKTYSGEFNTKKIVDFYSKHIKEYMDHLNSMIKTTDRKYPIVMRKMVIGALGGSDNEIYKYADLIWKKYVYDRDVNCPYILDGVIFSPLDQKYVTSVKETKFFDYKMKPPQKNSIDMYIMFERDPDTGKILTVFDNSKEEYVKGKPYRIANLYVGKQTQTGEKPVLFQQNARKYIAHLFLKDGEVRDETGAIIKDKTVVEFYYNTTSGIEDTHRWNPMRTRYDKTELVYRYKKSYGNYVDVANKVWRSIINPVTFTDIEMLADDSKYRQQADFLKNRIDHSLILSEKKENVFNQIRRNLAKPMRNFHNWIRSILIYTYFNQIYEKGTKLSVLDIGCGRGEDMMKFYYTMSDFYVGIDSDQDALLSAADGAVSRYNQLRKTHPNFPKYTFVHADAAAPLDYDSQVKILGTMSQNNRSLMEKYFSSDPKKRTLFDRVNCQDVVQYLLKDEMTWSGFLTNLNSYLKEGGFFVFTCPDSQQIQKAFGTSDRHTVYYNTEKGEKRVLFEILKKYSDEDLKNSLGNSIDFHSFEEQEGVYKTQYLVDKDFIVKELNKKCDMELVETDLYSDQFKIHSDYFKYIYRYEENEKTREFFRKVAEFYDQTGSVNQACFKLTKLYRLYVFRKRAKKVDKPQKGGYFLDKQDNSLFVKRVDKTDSYSFMNSVIDCLKSAKLVPQTSSAVEIFGSNYQPDDNLNEDSINKVLKRVKIYHNNKPVVSGLSVVVAEEDCNGEWDKTVFGSTKSKQAVYLFKTDSRYTNIYDKDRNGYFEKSTILD